LHCILIDTILIAGESLDKLIFMKKMNEDWSSHCQQIIMCRFVSRIFSNSARKNYCNNSFLTVFLNHRSIFLFLDRTYVLQHAGTPFTPKESTVYIFRIQISDVPLPIFSRRRHEYVPVRYRYTLAQYVRYLIFRSLFVSGYW